MRRSRRRGVLVASLKGAGDVQGLDDLTGV